MPDIASLVADLRDESDELVSLLRTIDAQGWARATPSPRWDVAAQVAHLTIVDERALTSLTEPAAFASLRSEDVTKGLLAAATESYRRLPPDQLLSAFVYKRARFASAAEAADPAGRVAWYGPDMSVASMVTARIMETWAHGQDIVDAFELPANESARLRHIAYLGVATRRFSYANRGLPVPDEPVTVVLSGPDGATWKYGTDGAEHCVQGSALDFCLVVTQRRHIADTHLQTTPGPAAEWMSIAQAFAGSPGEGRSPGQFTGQQRGTDAAGGDR